MSEHTNTEIIANLALEYQAAAAKCGQQNFRLRTALSILRAWALGENYNANTMIVIRDWIDGGMGGPVPWPGGAFFEEWAAEQGWSNVHGFVGLRFTAQLVQPVARFELSDGRQFDVAPRYYPASCDRCGWAGSSQDCGTDEGCDDSDVYCPKCRRAGCDSGTLAATAKLLTEGSGK